eukprot:comp101620_c0_seq1/m.48742 comp101620_c0_seq1/g.48742  ORF comp101620_c0_seq1/g.48742 comp101620_c0_seq1/m.48742 type:complete len:375 (-) comp101620_c0_seq1:48-1172(-)
MAATEIERLTELFPLLVPEDANQRSYAGFICVQDHTYGLRVVLPPSTQSGSMADARVEGSWELCRVFSGLETALEQRLRQSASLLDFLLELKDMLEKLHRGSNAEPSTLPASFYTSLVSELEEVGWHLVSSLDEGLMTMELGIADEGKRPHTLSLRLSPNHPLTPPTCKASLPHPFVPKWTQRSRLSHLVQQFHEVVSSHQVLWNNLDEIDRCTWVLEPDHPTRAHTLRRFAVGKNCSLQVDLDPLHPLSMPECRFLGADSMVQPLKEKLTDNAHLWNPSQSVLQNLQNVLATTFPTPQTTSREEYGNECGICYSYKLGDSVPEKVCDDERCRQPFHVQCLVEWMRALPSTRQSFNVIFGECPYCCKPMTVKQT